MTVSKVQHVLLNAYKPLLYHFGSSRFKMHARCTHESTLISYSSSSHFGSLSDSLGRHPVQQVDALNGVLRAALPPRSAPLVDHNHGGKTEVTSFTPAHGLRRS